MLQIEFRWVLAFLFLSAFGLIQVALLFADTYKDAALEGEPFFKPLHVKPKPDKAMKSRKSRNE